MFGCLYFERSIHYKARNYSHTSMMWLTSSEHSNFMQLFVYSFPVLFNVTHILAWFSVHIDDIVCINFKLFHATVLCHVHTFLSNLIFTHLENAWFRQWPMTGFSRNIFERNRKLFLIFWITKPLIYPHYFVLSWKSYILQTLLHP